MKVFLLLLISWSNLEFIFKWIMIYCNKIYLQNFEPFPPSMLCILYIWLLLTIMLKWKKNADVYNLIFWCLLCSGFLKGRTFLTRFFLFSFIFDHSLPFLKPYETKPDYPSQGVWVKMAAYWLPTARRLCIPELQLDKVQDWL